MTKDLDFPIYRALVTYSSVNTGEIRVLIPSLSGLSSETTISFIGRSATSGIWTVPVVGTQIVVTADDYTFTNIFWVQVQPVGINVQKIYVTKYTTNGNGTWTCPTGVTQIKLTLIGAGGTAGDVLAVTTNAQSGGAFSNTAAGSTTFIVGGTTYTALGGKKGDSVSITGPAFDVIGGNPTSTSSSNNGGLGTDFSRYPGCGGAPAWTYAQTQTTFDVLGEFLTHTSRASAKGYRGQDGIIEVSQVTVVPATVYSFSIGAGSGYTNSTTSYAGSNGAVIIEYVV